jgi:hypothetical protein
MFHQEFFIYHGFNDQIYEEDGIVFMDPKMPSSLGLGKTKI